jgi:glycosyltransferase domain-containing protein
LGEIAQAFRPKSKVAVQAVNGPPARLQLSDAADLVELANVTDALLALEIRTGCFGQVERLLADVSARVFDNRIAYAPEQEHAVERIWINLLRLGLFDELRHVIEQHALPVQTEVKSFIDYCALQYVSCRQRGEAYRAAHPQGDVFTMGCIVWGEVYIGNFLRYNLRSMLSDGNLPALRRQGRVVLSIVTNAAGERQMLGDALFAKVAELADVEFIVVPDGIIGTLVSGHLVRNFYILYGMLDHCSIFFALGAGSHLFMIPVDAVVAEGSLGNMANYRHEGYECCGGGNIVANTETFLPALDERYPGDAPITIATEDLASLAVANAHHYFTSQIIAADNIDFGKHPRELFWPREGGVEIHSVFIHPLFTTASGLANYRRKHYANIDYGMIPRMFAGSARIKIVEDPREAYVNNFTAAARLYETTGQPFAVEDFLRCHDWSYPVQKSLFGRAQALPCRLDGRRAYRETAADVAEIVGRFRAERIGPRSGTPVETELTIILPTHNRPEECLAQLRYLQGCSVAHRVIVADSSDAPDPRIKDACVGAIEYRHFEASGTLGAKLASVAYSVVTPYVALMTDDDISFLHAIDACLRHLQRHPDCVVAQGYVLEATADDDRIDIHGVRCHVEGVAEIEPLRRLYQLMRRYQPSFWAVFPKPAFLGAIDAFNAAQGVIFQELAFVSTLAVLGNSVRIPLVHTLRTNQESAAQATQGDPFYWFLKDAPTFFAGYVKYRDNLLRALRDVETGAGSNGQIASRRVRPGWFAGRAAEVPADVARHIQELDMIHARYFGRKVDTGMINHTARSMLGEHLPPLKPPKPEPQTATHQVVDTVHPSAVAGRRYVWRSAMIDAVPSGEVTIDAQEMARVEAALDEYRPAFADVPNAAVAFERRVIADSNEEIASTENVRLVPAGVGQRLIEIPRLGHHRLRVRVGGGRPGGTLSASLLAKGAGRSKLKLELHDDGAEHYGAAVFDLEEGLASLHEGHFAVCSIDRSATGQCRISVGLATTKQTSIHLAVALLDDDDALTYRGSTGMGISLLEIDLRGEGGGQAGAPP